MLPILFTSLALAAALNVPESNLERNRYEFLIKLAGNFQNTVPYEIPETGEIVVVATKDVNKGEPLIAVAVKDLITTFDSFEYMPYLKNADLEVILAARLIYERFINKSNTLSKRYVESLPHIVSNYFNFTSENTRDIIKYNALNLDISYSGKVLNDFEIYLKLIQRASNVPKEMLDFEIWKWAYGQLFRSMAKIPKSIWKKGQGYSSTPQDEETDGLGYYPFIELAPHCPSVDGTEFQSLVLVTNMDIPAIVLIADRNFKAGDRICYSHGVYDNFKLLFLKGSVIEKNIDQLLNLEVDDVREIGCTWRVRNGRCLFELPPTVISESLLNFIRKNRTEFGNADAVNNIRNTLKNSADTPELEELFQSLLSYRQLLEKEVFNKSFVKPLRKLRYDLLHSQTEERRLVNLFGISAYSTALQHLKLLERELLYSLFLSLNLNSL